MEIVKINTDYITLGQLLKYCSIIYSGAMAKEYLSSNEVLVNGEKEERRGRKLYPGTKILVEGREIKVE